MIDEEFPPLPSQAHQAKTSSAKRRICSRKESSHAVTKRNSTASINDLPDELLLEILDYLPGLDLEHFQLLTLTSLSLTNRRFHQIVSDRLYSAYDSFFCTPYIFLRTALSNPRLAAQVKTVSFRYGTGVHAERPAYLPSIFDKQVIKDSLKHLKIPEWKKWASDCNGEEVEQELLYTTILMCTPNITSLTIDDGITMPAYKPPKWLKLIREAANGGFFGRVHRFKHLKSIHVDLHFLRLRHLAPIFKIQSLRKVTFIGLVEFADTQQGTAGFLRRLLPPRTSFIEELNLEKSFLHIDVLNAVISSIRKLKSVRYWSNSDRFHIHPSGSDEYWDSHPVEDRHPLPDFSTNDLNKMTKCLHENHRSSLANLSVRNEFINVDFPYPLFHDTLCSFERLTNFEVPFFTLLHMKTGVLLRPAILVESLPRALQTLTLRSSSWNPSYSPALDDFAVRCHEHTPSLQKVIFMHNWDASLEKRRWKRFRELLHNQGVQLELKSEDEYAWSSGHLLDLPRSVSTSDEEDNILH